MTIKKTYFILLFIYAALTAGAQDNILYQFNRQAQANKLNPAYKPQCKVYIGLPVLSNLKLGYANSAFAYKDLFYKNGDSLQFNLEKLQQKKALNNHIRLDFSTDILNIGVAWKKYYFLFNVSNITQANISFPTGIFQLTNGNWNTRGNAPINFDFNTLGIFFNSYNSFNLSASKPLNKNLRAGVRIAYLRGITNLSTDSRHLGLQTGSFPINLTAIVDSRINSAGLLQIQAPAAGNYTPNVSINSSQLSVKNLILPPNTGWSVDLGIQYKYSDAINFNASIVNLGFINWKTGVNNVSFSGSYSFQGINFDNYLSGNSSSGNVVENLRDSILASFTYLPMQETYKDALPLHFYFSAEYLLSEKLEITALIHSMVYDQVIEASVSAGINYQLTKSLKTNATISYLNNDIAIGGGLLLEKKHTNFFLITENIPVQFAKISGTSILIPYSAQTLNLQLGWGIKLGCKKLKNQQAKSNTYCPAYPMHKNRRK